MELTRIEKENEEYFSHLCPDELMNDEDLMTFGVIDDEGYASCACAVGVSENMGSLKWIYTVPDLREKGSASFLLKEIEELGQELELDGLQVQFRASAEDLDDFLADSGYLVGIDSQVYSVPISDLIYGRVVEELLSKRSGDAHVCGLPTDTEKKHKVITALAEIYELDPAIFSDISSQYSVICFDENNKPESAIFVTEYGDEDLFVNYLLSDGSVSSICELIGAFNDVLIKNERTEGRLIFTDRDDKSITLIERLTENDRDEFRIPGWMYAVKLFV
ncbi:MAG: hypothetical protein J5509_08695 [Lachnospiraceae bacterium]|nr:hypothetical protein [Lachnospiraceae bacterium]